MENPVSPKKVKAFVQIVVIASLVALSLGATDILSNFESSSWDWRLRALARYTKADPSIKIITIDQLSLDYMAKKHDQVWPWPRQLYVPILEFLKSAGARGVAFDMLFTEASAKGVYDDEDFAGAIVPELPVVLAAAPRHGKSQEEIAALTLFLERQSEVDRRSSLIEKFKLFTPKDPGALTLPIPQLIKRAASFGNVNIPNDADGVFRHTESGSIFNGAPLLNLPFALYAVTNPQSTPDLSALSNGKLALRFAGPSRTYKTFSYFAILESFALIQEGKAPIVPLQEFKDAYIFVGMDAPGLLDLRPTPLAPMFPGVEFNATALDNLLHGAFIKKIPFVGTIIFSILLSTIAAAGMLATNKIASQLTVGLAILGGTLSVCFAAAFAGWWLPLVVPMCCVIIALLLSLGAQFQIEGAQVRFIKQAFKHYVSPEVIDGIIADPTQLALGGQRRELTIFFCDIAGFTTMSEKMDAARLGQFLNQFLSEMTQILLRSGGTVDKYVGDAIVAFWNAPLSVPDHARRAVQASIACQERLEQLRPQFAKEYGVDVGLRIGLNTGYVSVGNFGSAERFSYTIIGDAANLASRLEGANKPFGTEIMIADSTYVALHGEIPCARIATIGVVGRAEPLAVYAPFARLGSAGEQIAAAVERFEAGDLGNARKLFEALSGNKKLKEIYLDRINEEATLDGTTPSGWQAVWRLTDK
jgi:adenylate cyclase